MPYSTTSTVDMQHLRAGVHDRERQQQQRQQGSHGVPRSFPVPTDL